MSCRHQGAGQCHDISDKLELSMSFHVTICPGNSSGEGGYKEVIGGGGGGVQVLPLQKGGAGESIAVVLTQILVILKGGGGCKKILLFPRGTQKVLLCLEEGGGRGAQKSFGPTMFPFCSPLPVTEALIKRLGP